MASRRCLLLRSSALRSLHSGRLNAALPSSSKPALASVHFIPVPPRRRSGDALLLSMRSFSSSSSERPTSFTLLVSDQEFESTIKKIEDERSEAVFYFTANWCGPCKLVLPALENESNTYGINIYKIDIDEDGIQNTLSKLQIHAVPTLHFFQHGKKADQTVGADLASLKRIMKSLYG